MRLRPIDNFGVRREPNTPGLREPDQLVEDPDARAVADHMRVHRQLEQPAIVVGRLELAAEDVETSAGGVYGRSAEKRFIMK